MKKNSFYIFLSKAFAQGVFAALLLFYSSLPAFGYNNQWSLEKFDSHITVNKDASFIVNETIVADFSRESHHGIFRLIPVDYKDKYGNNVSIRVSVLSVMDGQKKAWNYETSREGEYLKVKIGDANTYLYQPTTFIITYKVERALLFFDDHDELYWNVTGNGWDVSIKNVTAEVQLPSEIKESGAICYTGIFGSSDKNCHFEIQKNTVQFSSDTLGPNEGLTIAVRFPKDIIVKPPFIQAILWFLLDNWGYFIPFLVFGFLLYRWRIRGRDPEASRMTIMPHYTPPDNLSPTEIGTIIDEKVDIHDITASIIDLAVRGYLKITEKKEKKFLFETTTYTLTKLKDFEIDMQLKEFERIVLKGIFANKDSCDLNDLKNRFYTKIPTIQRSVYSQLVDQKYFPASPDTVRSRYLQGGVMIVGLGFWGFWLMFALGLSVPIGVMISGILVVIFGQFMPARTVKGVETFYKIKGLEEYILTAEKDRLKFQEQENIFEKLLPYAMCLGIAEKWTKAFDGIITRAPSWFESNDPSFMNTFSTYYFMGHLNGLSTTMASSMQSAPRTSSVGGSGFSGGGFSGGGFGGGGGGAW